jgi:glycosyltransferase involved in cell wall biosynthesis
LKLIYHYKPPGASGGVEKFERELEVLISEIKSDDLVFNLGNFVDVFIARYLTIVYKKKVFLISHVNINWLHLRNRHFRLLTKILLDTPKIQLLLLAKNQIQCYKFVNSPKVIGTFTRPFKGNIDSESVVNGRVFENNSFVLYYGRLNEEKNILNLIQTWPLVSRKELIIIGPSSSKYYRRKIQSISLRYKNVKVLDAVTFEILEEYIEKCDYGIIHSYSDTLPLMFIEMYVRFKWCIVNSRCRIPEYLPSPLVYDLDDLNSLQQAVWNVENCKFNFQEDIFSPANFISNFKNVLSPENI